jgi:putative flippase GtrA
MSQSNKIVTLANLIQLFKSHLPKLFKFGVIGASAAIIDFSVFAFLLRLFASSVSADANPGFSSIAVANTAGILVGFVWSFFLQKHWAFEAKGNAWLQFIATAMLLGFNIILTSFAIPIVSTKAAISLESSKILMQFVVVAWNYVIYNYLIFRQLDSTK